MSGHEREGGRSSHGGYSSRRPESIELTPAQRAEDAVQLAARTVSDLEVALIGVQRAEEANDLQTWSAKRQALDVEIQQTSKVIERAARTTDDKTNTQLAQLRTRYAVAVTAASAHVVAPRGFEPSRLDDELMRAVTAGGKGKLGMEQKEDAIRAILGQLNPTESRQLVARIKKPVPEDALAAAFRKVSNLGSERLERLLTFARDASRRAAQRAEIEHSLGPSPEDAVRAEVDHSLGPDPATSSKTEAAHDLVDGFQAATAVVAKDFKFPEHRAERLPAHDDAASYLSMNAAPAWDALRAYLQDVSWPDLPEGLVWQSEGQFSDDLVRLLRKQMPGLSHEAVSALLYPHDVFAIIDSLRPEKGHLGWVPAIGIALGQLVQRVTVRSIHRVGPRLVDAANKDGEVDASSIASSHPMDNFIVRALRDHNAARIEVGSRKRRGASRGKQPIKLVWQGAGAWNWVRAEPADATPEEVIEQLAAEHGGHEHWFADALAVAPPMFGIPAAWARSIPAAAAHMPTSIAPASFDRRLDTPEARLVELTRHGDVAEQAATYRAGGPAAEAKPISAAQVIDTLADCSIQLGTIHKGLARWELGDLTAEALVRVGQKQAELLGASPPDVAAWAPVATGQRRRLHAIGDALGRIDHQVGKLGDHDRQGGGMAPVRAIVRKLGGAAAASHIASASDALFEDAVRAQADLSIDSIQAQILDVAATTGGPRGARRWDSPSSTNVTDQRLADEGEAALPAARQVQDRLINGREVAPADIADATLATQETALRTRLNGLFVQSGGLQVAAAEAGSGATGKIASLFSSRFRDLGDVTKSLRLHIGRVTGDWDEALLTGAPTNHDGTAPPKVTDPTKRRAALDLAEKSYASIREDHELMKFLQDGQSIVEAQQLRKLCVNLVAMIGLAFVAQTAAGAVAESMGAAFLSAEGAAVVGELSAGARYVTIVTSGAVDIGINSVGQAALTDATLKSAVIDNLVFAFGTRMIAGPLSAEVSQAKAMARALAEEAYLAGAIERRIESIMATELKAVGWIASRSVEITGETLTNVALANLAAKLQGHPSATPQDAREWFLQALSVAVGKTIHAALGERMPSLARLAKRTDASAAERRLFADAMQLEHIAGTLSTANVHGGDIALKVLVERTRLLERELKLVEWRARWEHDPDAKQEVDARRAELEGQSGDTRREGMIALRMNLIGLHELVPGQAWRGTTREAQRAAKELQAGGHTVAQSWDPSRKFTTLTVDGLALEIYERPATSGARDAPVGEAGRPKPTHELATDLAMVPGSELRGATPGAAAVTPEGMAALKLRAAQSMADVAVAADVNGIEPLPDGRFLVTLRDGTMTVIEVAIVRIEDHDVARLLPNSSRETHIGSRTAHGEHVIQLSSHLPLDQVERALAHAVARLTTVHERAQRGSFGDGPRDNTGQPVGVSAEASGRLAELRVLVRRLAEHPEDAAAVRREIVALADDLGVIGAEPSSKVRRAQLEQQLAPREREELERASRDARDRSRSERATLDEVREAARQDIADDLARDYERGNDRHAQYELGGRLSREDLSRLAASAARLRSLESHHTLQRLRAEAAKLGPRQHPRIDSIQVGGGMALAGRSPQTLLVDLRGRWQADGSLDIAQTAQQLGELYKARFGDTRHVARPKERVPLEAIRFWEDSLAAMGPVIDGQGAPRMEGDRMLMDITPTDGSEMLTIEIGGVPTFAPGFVPEAVPGAPRMNMVDVMTTLETQLEAIESDGRNDPELRTAAQVAVLRLREIGRPRATDTTRIADALAGPQKEKLETALRQRDTSAEKTASKKPGAPSPPKILTNDALAVVEAGEKWAKLKSDDAADGVDQVAFGDEANLEWRVTQMLSQLDAKLHPTTGKPIRVVMAGAGGTAVSAAEIVLARANTTVTMIGRDTPAGLLKNQQFADLAAKHADAELAAMLGIRPGDGRLKMFLKQGISFDVPRPSPGPSGTQAYEAYPAREGRPQEFVGDVYVVSAGRTEQTPPVVSDLILQTTRGGGTVSYRGDFDADGQYTGYTVILTRKGGGVRELRVTGAASRYVPIVAMETQGGVHRQAAQDIRDASTNDAPAATGTFAGGAAASGVQGHRNAARENQQDPSPERPHEIH